MANELNRELTEIRLEVFFETLARTGNIAESCRASSLNRRVVTGWRQDDEVFARRWADALLDFEDSLRLEAFRRSVEGTLEPTIYQGRLCYEIAHDETGRPCVDGDGRLIPVMEGGKPKVLGVRKFSDTLLTNLLKAKCAEFRDVSRIEMGNIPGEEFKTNNDVDIARKVAFVIQKGLRNVRNATEVVPDDGSDLA